MVALLAHSFSAVAQPRRSADETSLPSTATRKSPLWIRPSISAGVPGSWNTEFSGTVSHYMLHYIAPSIDTNGLSEKKIHGDFTTLSSKEPDTRRRISPNCTGDFLLRHWIFNSWVENTPLSWDLTRRCGTYYTPARKNIHTVWDYKAWLFTGEYCQRLRNDVEKIDTSLF